MWLFCLSLLNVWLTDLLVTPTRFPSIVWTPSWGAFSHCKFSNRSFSAAPFQNLSPPLPSTVFHPSPSPGSHMHTPLPLPPPTHIHTILPTVSTHKRIHIYTHFPLIPQPIRAWRSQVSLEQKVLFSERSPQVLQTFIFIAGGAALPLRGESLRDHQQPWNLLSHLNSRFLVFYLLPEPELTESLNKMSFELSAGWFFMWGMSNVCLVKLTIWPQQVTHHTEQINKWQWWQEWAAKSKFMNFLFFHCLIGRKKQQRSVEGNRKL